MTISLRLLPLFGCLAPVSRAHYVRLPIVPMCNKRNNEPMYKQNPRIVREVHREEETQRRASLHRPSREISATRKGCDGKMRARVIGTPSVLLICRGRTTIARQPPQGDEWQLMTKQINLLPQTKLSSNRPNQKGTLPIQYLAVFHHFPKGKNASESCLYRLCMITSRGTLDRISLVDRILSQRLSPRTWKSKPWWRYIIVKWLCTSLQGEQKTEYRTFRGQRCIKLTLQPASTRKL